MDVLLGKVFAVIETLAGADKGRGVNELARELKLPASNVHRVLRALTELKYVQQDVQLRTYSLTPRIFEIGMAVGGRLDLKVLARPELELLSTATREDIGLTILEQHDIVYIDHIQARHAIRTFQTLGRHVPAFCSAAGRVMLAFRADGEALIRTSTRTAFTERTVTDVKSLIALLRRIQRVGHAISIEERHMRISTVAAPILDRSGAAVAALSIFGLTERMRPKMRDYAPLVMQAAERISERLRGGLPALSTGAGRNRATAD